MDRPSQKGYRNERGKKYKKIGSGRKEMAEVFLAILVPLPLETTLRKKQYSQRNTNRLLLNSPSLSSSISNQISSYASCGYRPLLLQSKISLAFHHIHLSHSITAYPLNLKILKHTIASLFLNIMFQGPMGRFQLNQNYELSLFSVFTVVHLCSFLQTSDCYYIFCRSC